MKNGKSYVLTASYAGAVAWNSCERKQRSVVVAGESEHINNLKFIYIENNTIEGLCPNCYNDRIYYKRDWSDLKANSIPLTFKVYFKGDDI